MPCVRGSAEVRREGVGWKGILLGGGGAGEDAIKDTAFEKDLKGHLVLQRASEGSSVRVNHSNSVLCEMHLRLVRWTGPSHGRGDVQRGRAMIPVPTGRQG